MATQKIDAANLASVISEYLAEYGQEVQKSLETAGRATGKKVAQELKKGGSYQTHKTGQKFNKGWTATEEKTRMGVSTIVHNTTVPGLAHLLEFGHAKRNGGRTRAFNFIAPVADQAESIFTSEVEKELSK